MTEALRRLMSGVIDYAGLFPPAKLDMASAVEEYLKVMNGPHRWMVSRFICPASRLDELGEILVEKPQTGVFKLTLTGSGGTDLDAFETGLESDAKAMTAFESQFGEQAPIEALEIRLPSYKDTARVFRDLQSFDSIEVFLELPWHERQVDTMVEVAEEEWIGVKARTGGLDASAFPTTRQLAAFLQQTVDLDLTFKLTAGLHHPIRHDNASVKTKMHGFLNALFATALHDQHGLGIEEIDEILADEKPDSFVLSNDGIRWRDLEADIDLIRETRQLFVGYGSCSVDEPVEDLVSLGLLNGEDR
ncbi:MAG: hypothetical protein KF784_13650 [Fimbriimonadaceae bacterium]|nr:hypothetical protein [Fimbriimonadaceae bacterium]